MHPSPQQQPVEDLSALKCDILNHLIGCPKDLPPAAAGLLMHPSPQQQPGYDLSHLQRATLNHLIEYPKTWPPAPVA